MIARQVERENQAGEVLKKTEGESDHWKQTTQTPTTDTATYSRHVKNLENP